MSILAINPGSAVRSQNKLQEDGLGTCGIVVLQMEIDETGQNFKPLWQGELKDCGVLMGTNVLTDFGLSLCNSGLPGPS